MFQVNVGYMPTKEAWSYKEAIEYLQELNPDWELVWGSLDVDSEEWIIVDSQGRTVNTATIRTV